VRYRKFLATAALLTIGPLPLHAQTAPAPPPPLPPLAIAEPHYVSFSLQVDVDRPAAEAWQRIGKYCAISEWFQMSCRLTAGDEWSVGSVRLLRESIIEVLVARTPLSYTYAQPVRVGVPYNLYHGTLAIEPVSAKRSKIVYTFLFDNSMLSEEARVADIAARKERFGRAMANMKMMAEGGKVPPAK